MEARFELVRWQREELDELTRALADEGIEHRLEGTDLVVAEGDEQRTDDLIERITDPGSDPGSPDADSDEDEVGYQLDGWEPAQIESLERDLENEGIDYGWEDGTLVVAAVDEAAVDAVVAEVEGTVREAMADLVNPTKAVVGDPSVLETPAFIDPATLVLAGHPPLEVRQLLQDLLFRSDGADRITVTAWARRLLSLLPSAPKISGMAGDGRDGDDRDQDGGDQGGGDHDELVYELVDWTPQLRQQLVLVLEREGIAYEWDGNDLVVPAAFEQQVDGFIDQMEQADELAAAGSDGDDEATYHVMSELFDAADRLTHDPADIGLCGELVTVADRARDLPPLFGIDETLWKGILERSAATVQAIEQEQNDDLVVERAALLRDALRGFV
ncbi:MAG: hypothetical protein QOG64_340 [Acidimicrobiaceae bacterium]|nr:hypothetical protein [Acidimicrobiaceae bacterium]